MSYVGIPGYAGAQAPLSSIGVAPSDAVLTDTYAVSNDAPAINEALTTLQSRGGGTLWIPAGSHRLKSTVNVTGTGMYIDGGSRDRARFIIDDSAGNIGDGFQIKNSLACSLRNVTITAQTARTAGNAVRVIGGYSTETLDPGSGTFNLRDSGTLITDVDMRDQFNGIVVESDDVLNYQNWRTYIRGGHHRNFSNGGCGIRFNTASNGGTGKFGASHFIENYYFDTTPTETAGGALAGIRLSGTGDITLLNNEVYGPDYALLIDPPASGFVACVTVLGGFYDTANVNCLRIVPDGSVHTFGVLKFIGPWFGTAFTGHAAYINGPAAKGMSFNTCHFANSLTGWGAVVTGASNFEFIGCHFSSCSDGGLFVGTASDFVVQGNKFVLKEHSGGINALPIGIHIDAGCDHYSVTGNIMREPATPLTNTPGDSANRRIATGGNNVTA